MAVRHPRSTDLDRPLVSIVTPTLNAGGFIEQVIKCVMAQGYQNHEHIVVDGGSNDKTVSILRKYEHRKNFHWISESDRGLYDAINKGLRMSRGKIQSFLPADDLYLPWTLESVVRDFERDRTVDIVYGDGMIARMSGAYAMVYFNPPRRSLRKHLRISSSNTTPYFWKKEVFEELGGYDLGFEIASDYDFIVRACMRFKVSKVSEVLTLWRMRPDSVSVDRQRVMQEVLRISSKVGGVHSSKGIHVIYAKMARNYLANSYPEFIRLTALRFSDDGHGNWGNLIRSKTISKSRLLRDLLTPFLPQFLLTRSARNKFFPGYVKMNKLLEFVTTFSPDAR